MIPSRLAGPVALALALSTAAAGPPESLLARLLRIAGLTSAPSQLRGPRDEKPGQLWTATLEAQTTRALTRDGGYRSPVFSPAGAVYALKGDAIVVVGSDGTVSSVQTVPGIVKLIGFEGTVADDIVVLVDSAKGGSPLATVALKSGALTALPYDPHSDQERQMVAQIRSQDRVYGDLNVYTKTNSKQLLSRPIEWTDVYVQRGTTPPRNVSACDGVDCTQPALSPDRRTVVYVRSEG
jgi:hypothetical protein